MLALLEAQRAYFASDQRVRERASIWRDATPEQRLAAVAEQCREADYFLSLKAPAELERVLSPVPLSEDIIAILEALQRRR
jgi:hypothetical protein